MYEKFYNLSMAPFNLSPDPRFLYMAPSHYEAFAAMLSGVRERRGITIITGPPGIGKTTLARALLDNLDQKTRSSFVCFTKVSFEQLLGSVLRDLGVSLTDDNLFGHMQHLFAYLSERLAQDETVALIIDEAQGLDASVLNDILRLSTRPQPTSKFLQIVLLGLPEFEATLNSEELLDLRDKTAVRRRIRALSRDESKAYINHRLKVAGSTSADIFTPDAIDLITQFADGIPRVINTVCDTVLGIGYANSIKMIDKKTVKTATDELGHLAPSKPDKPRRVQSLPTSERGERSNSLRRAWYAILAVAILAVFIVFYLGPWRQQEVPQMEEKATKPVPVQEEKKDSTKLRKKIIAAKGSTLTGISMEYYGTVNPTILDLILEANPKITDVDRIEINQEVTLPPISEESFLMQSPNGTYTIHIVTTVAKSDDYFLRKLATFTGKKIAIVPHRVSHRKTWYRVQAGPFANNEEALSMIRSLSQKGLMAGFAGRTR
jgi:general secretion pathway protein A